MTSRRPTRVLAAAAALLVGLGASRADAVCQQPSDPDCVKSRLPAFTGTVDFFATGASFALIDDPNDDRPGQVIDTAEVVVPGRRIPSRARLVRAFLYFGGSLFIDQDGIEAPDTEVEIEVPNAAGFKTVNASDVFQSAAIPGFPEVTLYTARADITDIMMQAGGQIAGTYRVRGFAADILYRTDKHTAANASFSIVLIFEEQRMSPRTIVVFDGMQEVLGSTLTLDLGGFIVSPRPSGDLTLYALEGDCNPGPGACDNGNNLSGLERVVVIGEEPGRQITLTDPHNPSNDIFNRTINTVDPPLRNVPGTDIDSFDISAALEPADTKVTVQITAPAPTGFESGELIGLAYVIVGIDVFAPELRVDSRVEIRTERGDELDAYFPGDPLRVTYAVSNTGNLPASGVRLEAPMPSLVTDFLVVEEPPGTVVTIEPAVDGQHNGKVVVEGIGVRHGDATDLVVLVETQCPLAAEQTLSMLTTIGPPAEGGFEFVKTSSATIRARDRCGPRFFLFGGGGCTTVTGAGGTLPWSWMVLVLGLLLLRRPAGVSVAALLAFGVVNSACTPEIEVLPDQPPPNITGVTCPLYSDMIVVPSIAGSPAFCIDRFEAVLDDATGIGNPDQASGGFTGDGSTSAVAQSRRFTVPTSGVSWFQANAACRNAGKRLCTNDEWITACRGGTDATYPYGETFEPHTCNGYAAGRENVVEAGGMMRPELSEDGMTFLAKGCVTDHGAYDMSGNLWEWNSTPYFDGERRGLAGGGYASNKVGLRCVSNDSHAIPREVDAAYGFRCCNDFPAGN